LDSGWALAQRLIFREDDLLGFVLVGGLEAGAFAGGLVHAVEDPTANATGGQTVTCIHVVHATAE
jgi:hypothetical protein